MSALARTAVLFATILIVVRGDSLLLPVAHLFADHHHEMTVAPAGGNWQWASVDGAPGGAPALCMMREGHDHEMAPDPAPLRQISRSAASLGLSPAALLDHQKNPRSSTPILASLEAPQDVGKPDLALLAVLRV